MVGIVISDVFKWKNNKIYGKSPNIIFKNGDFRHISGIFGRKKNFSKIGLGYVMSIANTHLCAKNLKKLMMKSRESAKKPVFPAYFRHFRLEKIFFRKSGSVTFRRLPFCIFVPKIRKN